MKRATYVSRMIKSLLFSLFIAAAAYAPANADDWRVEGADRVVAISDIHGAYDAMVETLKNVGVIDDQLAWAGGTARLVIVGDILDRGPRSRDVMDLLMRLEDESQAAGGYVHVLIGNHESMNMIGDMRYVSKEEYAAFAADETLEERRRWFQAYLRRQPMPRDEADLKERFDSGLKRGPLMGATNKMKYWELYEEFFQFVGQNGDGAIPQFFSDAFARAYESEIERLNTRDRKSVA